MVSTVKIQAVFFSKSSDKNLIKNCLLNHFYWSGFFNYWEVSLFSMYFRKPAVLCASLMFPKEINSGGFKLLTLGKCFVCDRVSGSPGWLWIQLYSPGWLWAFLDPPTSQVLGVTLPGLWLCSVGTFLLCSLFFSIISMLQGGLFLTFQSVSRTTFKFLLPQS